MIDTQTKIARNFVRYFSCFAAAFILAQPSTVEAEDVWLNPGYINGIVNIDGVDIDYSYLTAVSGEFKATSYSSTGQYTLTVNTPVNDGYYYETSSFVYTDSRNDYLHFPHETVFVKDDETTRLDFNINPGILKGTFSVEEGCAIAGGRVYASADDSAATGGYLRDTTNWIGSRSIVGADGSFSFPVVAGTDLTIAAYVTRSNGEHINLDTKLASVEPGQTTEVNWEVGCGGIQSTIYGSIGVLGVDNLTSHQVRAKKIGTGAYIDAEIYCEGEENDCTYQFSGITPGTWQIYPAITELNDADDEFRYPRGIYNFEITVEAGQILRNDIVADAAFINGNLSLKGVKSIQDADWAEVAADGKYNTPSYAGWSYDFVNSLNGDFDLVVSEGEWRNFYSRFYFFNNDPADYLRSYLYVYDYSMPFLAMTAGDTVESAPLEYQTGSVTVRYTVDNDGVLSFPSLRGNTAYENGKYSYVQAYGSVEQTTEGVVSFIGIPGSYNLIAEAYVGGSRTTFGDLAIEVVYGGDRDLDIGSPILAVESPMPEEYTENLSIIVSGKTTDEDGVREITINGEDTEFASTDNLADHNEVYYSKEVALEPGPNKIEITVTDNLDKSITDSRSVYVDNEYPTINWEPVDGTSTVGNSVTAIGTATDDNTITVITVNGQEVEFTTTENPDDPNEVEFSLAVDLEIGANQLVVVASDNCKLSTSETHTINRIEPDTTAPSLTCPLNQTAEFGETVPLGNPIVSDNTDLSPKVTNNAPGKFSLGQTEVVWAAADIWGNKSTCTQLVTIVDKTPPTITCPANTTINFGEKVFLGMATAKDNADKAVKITSDRPSQFKEGSTTVNWKATDSSGNTSSCQQVVTVNKPKDLLKSFIVTPDTHMLWPPNHKYVTIKVDITAVSTTGKDLSDLVSLVSVSSDEPENLQEKSRSFKNKVAKINNRIVKANRKIAALKKAQKKTGLKIAASKKSIRKTSKRIVSLKKAKKATNRKISVLKKEKINSKQRKELKKQQNKLRQLLKAHKNQINKLKKQTKSLQSLKKASKKISANLRAQRNVRNNLKKHLVKINKLAVSNGDGNTTKDIVILSDNTIKLRAERIGGDNGRVYTLNYTITDADGSNKNISTKISVPKSPKKKAIDSGIKYLVVK